MKNYRKLLSLILSALILLSAFSTLGTLAFTDISEEKGGLGEATIPGVTESTFGQSPIVTLPAFPIPTESVVTTIPTEAIPTEPVITTTPTEAIPTEPVATTTPTEAIPTEPVATTTPTEAIPTEPAHTNVTPTTTPLPTEITTPTQETIPNWTGPYSTGDVDRDFKLSVKDATLIQKYLADTVSLDDEQFILADVNRDTSVNIKDATLIQKKIAGIVVDSIDSLPEVLDGYNRYFFYKPKDNWENASTTSAGIYWKEGSETPESFPGYKMNLIKNYPHGSIYFYDVPKDVKSLSFNNFFYGGEDSTSEFFKQEIKTVDVSVGVSGMIFITDAYKIETNLFSGRQTYDGDWFYYYGNGEYGFYPEKPADLDYVYDAPMSSWYLHIVCDCGSRHNSPT